MENTNDCGLASVIRDLKPGDSVLLASIIGTARAEANWLVRARRGPISHKMPPVRSSRGVT